MATSQNGWSVIDRSGCATIRVGRNKVPIPVRRGVVAEVFAAFADEYDRTVEPLLAGQCWGHAVRNIRGSATAVTNHASATAVDLNSLDHMRGVKGTFTATQKARVRKLLSYLVDPQDGQPVLRWGEDYKSVIDGMHYEVHEANEAALRRALNNFLQKLEDEKRPNEPEKPASDGVEAPRFPLGKGEFFFYADGGGPAVSGLASRLPNGNVGHPGLLLWQRQLRDRGWGITTDGVFGDQTFRITKLFQEEKRLKDIDGKIGPETWAAAWEKPIT